MGRALAEYFVEESKTRTLRTYEANSNIHAFISFRTLFQAPCQSSRMPLVIPLWTVSWSQMSRNNCNFHLDSRMSILENDEPPGIPSHTEANNGLWPDVRVDDLNLLFCSSGFLSRIPDYFNLRISDPLRHKECPNRRRDLHEGHQGSSCYLADEWVEAKDSCQQISFVMLWFDYYLSHKHQCLMLRINILSMIKRMMEEKFVVVKMKMQNDEP